MPAASSKRMTPARKRAKLDHDDDQENTTDSAPTETPSRKTTRRRQAAEPSPDADDITEPAEDALPKTTAPAPAPAPATATAIAESALSTPAQTPQRLSRSAKSKAQARLVDVMTALTPDLDPEAISSGGNASEAGDSTDHTSAFAEASSSTQTRATASPSGPGTPPPLAGTSRQPSRSTKIKAKARFQDDGDGDDDYKEAAAPASEQDSATPPLGSSSLSTPAKTPLRTPRSAKGKGRAKFEQDDYDDEEENIYGKNPDLEIFTQEGPLSTLQRIQLKTNKPRSLRPLWLQGVYHPPFFGIPTADVLSSVTNHDGYSQPELTHDKQPIESALPWPNEGHAQTWLDPNAYSHIKQSLVKFWFGHVGWIPNEGVYDWGWYPGKAFGWKQNRERSHWAHSARQQIRNGSSDADKVITTGNRPGWPFVQPWLDTHPQSLLILSGKDALPFLRDTTTPQRSDLRHPTTVMKLTVPELTMRNRLKKSIITDTPKSVKKASRAKTDAGDAGNTEEADEEDDAADQDENAIAALDANQEPINPQDPKFSNIPNLGFEEKGPICGQVLHISVGPPDREAPVQIAKGTSRRLDSLGVVPDEGHILNVGGHVYGLDWVPIPVHLNTGKEYFAASAATTKSPVTFIGRKQERPVPASLQIWSVSPDSTPDKAGKGEAQLEMVICHEAGAAYKLAWCPIGHDFLDADLKDNEKEGRLRRLGLLAGCFADGSVSVFSVPHPDAVQTKGKMPTGEPIHVRLDPILRLEHPQQAATSLAWAGGEMLAFGGSQGWIGVWNVGQIFRQRRTPPSLSEIPSPYYVVRAHRSSITDMTFILLPPLNSNGLALTSNPPLTLFTVSLDGWTAHTNLTHASPSVTSIERSRAVHYACAFSPFTGGSLVHEHADGSVAHYSLRPEEMFRSRQISHTPSRVLSLSTSSFHPILAMGSAHGEVKLANILRTLRRTQRNHLPIYQMVVDRSTGELVIRHHLEPEIANNAEAKNWHIAPWHPCLAVTAVRWNPNLGRCRLLLSGTAVGMVKVDFVKPPYERS
ncbi:uncharacterized protein UTRI_05917 [Ustilago trichophora]|uniref:Transcription factor TFIIIC complex subunit Tfc6 n=1 Tax=Ustilago trichophora TaxID=86804 RepID=A0A5C3EHP6_9BASI|nr:uncharacterized protein UTRI_05917 [Ustilago trichophora]